MHLCEGCTSGIACGAVSLREGYGDILVSTEAKPSASSSSKSLEFSSRETATSWHMRSRLQYGVLTEILLLAFREEHKEIIEAFMSPQINRLVRVTKW